MNASIQPKRTGLIWGLSAFAILFCGVVSWVRQGRDFWTTPDQRGQSWLNAGDPAAAATSFADPFRRGVAQFQSGDFKSAASTFAGLPGQDALFNQANARIMLGEYDTAVELYDRILAKSPGRMDALTNRTIAEGRAERIKDEGGEMTGGKLGADEIVFNDTPSRTGGDDVEVTEEDLGNEQTRAMWLRQVETTPADFLKAKFAYQLSQRNSGEANPNDP